MATSNEGEEFISLSETDIYFVEAVNEIEIESTLSSCGKCGKVFHSTIYFNRHIKLCGNDDLEDLILSPSKIVSFVDEVKQNCNDDDCLNIDFKHAVTETCNDLSIDSRVLKKFVGYLQPLAREYNEKKNSNTFWEVFLGFVREMHALFTSRPSIIQKAVSYIMMKLGEKILAHLKSGGNSTDTSTSTTFTTGEKTERDDDILEYLGGYVMQHLYRKIKRSKQYNSDKNIKVCNILEAGRSETIAEQRLISCKSRGGLWGVTKPCFNIFKIIEDVFTSRTNVENFKKFNLDILLEEMLANENVVSNFEIMLEDAVVEVKDHDIAYHVLQLMVKLYIRVRAFSYAKKITELHTMKQKSLRKEMKRQHLQ